MIVGILPFFSLDSRRSTMKNVSQELRFSPRQCDGTQIASLRMTA
jgi:hypothetical protein